MLLVLPLMAAAALHGLTGHATWPFQQDSVVMAVWVDAAYDDSDSSIARLSQLTEILPPLRTRMDQSDLAHLILDRYTVSAASERPLERKTDSELPRTYDVLVKSIVAMNQLSDGAHVQAGQELLIPPVPRLAPRGSEDNPFNQLPRIVQLELTDAPAVVEDSLFTLGAFEFTDTRHVVAASDVGKSQRYVILKFSVPADAASRFGADFPEFFESFPALLAFQSMGVDLLPASDTGLAQGTLLAQGDRAKLTALLKGAKRSVSVFILDSGWPSDQVRSRSFDALWEMLHTARQLVVMEAQPKKPSLPAFKEPQNGHCKDILAALQELLAIPGSDSVTVVFVPMSKEQGATPLISELLYVHYAVRLKTDLAQRRDQDFSVQGIRWEPQYAAQAREYATRALKTVPTSIPPGGFTTSAEVLQALVRIANLVAQKRNTLFFVNESWTVRESGMEFSPPAPLAGVLIAAAGNSPGRNVHGDAVSAPLDFAQRSLNSKDYLAVMQMDGGGALRCGSSSVDPLLLNDILAVGYDGWTPDRRCGTSLAAPRVAWFLAAAEAVRPLPSAYKGYGNALHRALLRLRRPDAGLRGLWFDPLQYLAKVVAE